MSIKEGSASVFTCSFFAFSLVLILSVRAETVRQLVPTPVRKSQPNVITVTAGKSANVLVPGPLPKTQARLLTTPKVRGEQATPVPNVTVIPGNEDPGKTGRYYSIRTTTKTPQGTYQLQYYDGQKKSWNAVPTNVVQVRVVAASQPAARLERAVPSLAQRSTAQQIMPSVTGAILGGTQVQDNTYTIANSSSGGDCVKLGEEYARREGIGTVNAKWDGAARECEVHNIRIYEKNTVIIQSGAALRVVAQLNVDGTINNEGKLIVGGFPRKHESGFTVGGTLTVRSGGKINNSSGAAFLCFTNSYVDILGEVSNQGVIDFDCKVQLKKAQGAGSGGSLVNDGTLMLDMGTMGSNNYPSRTINDGKLFTEQGTTIINNGSIYQRKNSYGEQTSVVNRGVIDNYKIYNMTGGNIRNWGQFRNICNGVVDGWNIVEGNPAESKPCDRDGDGIPDSVDQCPDDKEIFNGLMDSDGCPDAMGGGSPQ